MQKVLVTGAAGFIGSHIVDELIRQGYDVTGLDNLSHGKKKNVNPKARLIIADISDDLSVLDNYDYVVHHASQIDVMKSIENPLYDANTNILGSLNLLEFCRKTYVKKIIYASTGGAIYGKPKQIPTPETCSVDPDSHYGVSKHTVEHYLEIYRKLYRLNYCILRYSNVYGPRQDCDGEGGVIPIFIKKMLNKDTPMIYGNGNQTRDFVFVKDVVNANLLAITKKVPKRIINIGTGKETSINELHEMITKTLDIDIPKLYGHSIKGEIKRSAVDITVAREYLKWAPSTSLSQGIALTIDALKEKNI
ncbi:NAD-dependent epimerase/dehydratase family protein [Candidatus Woesearchaeota archaeon]|nr:NAD-dependent epimerase/dehydratase family protein [Candidatus Woesearchaeota archaeon]